MGLPLQSAPRQRVNSRGRRAGVVIASDALVLGIESSCDDTGVAVVRASDGAILGQARPTAAQTRQYCLRRGSSFGGTACAARARAERRGGAPRAAGAGDAGGCACALRRRGAQPGEGGACGCNGRHGRCRAAPRGHRAGRPGCRRCHRRARPGDVPAGAPALEGNAGRKPPKAAPACSRPNGCGAAIARGERLLSAIRSRMAGGRGGRQCLHASSTEATLQGPAGARARSGS